LRRGTIRSEYSQLQNHLKCKKLICYNLRLVREFRRNIKVRGRKELAPITLDGGRLWRGEGITLGDEDGHQWRAQPLIYIYIRYRTHALINTFCNFLKKKIRLKTSVTKAAPNWYRVFRLIGNLFLWTFLLDKIRKIVSFLLKRKLFSSKKKFPIRRNGIFFNFPIRRFFY